MMAPAKTGSESNKRIAVISTDHTNNGILSRFISLDRIFRIVVIKLIAPKIEEIPAKCSLKIVKSTLLVVWNKLSAKGGYTVQPVPAPIPEIEEEINNVRDGGSNQNLMLFIRGKAISGDPIIKGTSQLPNPPIITGMTMKKIITNAWAVTIVL